MKFRVFLVKVWAYTSIAIVSGIILFLFGYIFYRGASIININFLTKMPQGAVIGSEGGILPAIIGSLYFTFVACVFGSIFSIATAIYIVFYCKSKKIAMIVQNVIQCISGIPSIVLGLFGYSLLILSLGIGRSIFTGGITLGIMILPFIEVRVEKALRELNENMLNSSYSLGVSKFYTIRKIVLPACKGEIVSSIILGCCYAMGATAPLIFTGAVINSPVPTSLNQPSMTLTYHLYRLLTEGTSTENAYGTAFVLMVIVLISNTLATLYSRRRNKRWKQ